MGWRGERVWRGRRHTVYLWLIHVDVGQKITQYCKDIILPLKINKFVLKKTYRRKEKQKKKINFELGSWMGPQGQQPACNSFRSQETMFGKMRSSSLLPIGTMGGWFLLSDRYQFRRKWRFFARRSVEEPELRTQSVHPNPWISAQEISGMGCEVEYLLYYFLPSLGEGKCLV